MTQDTSLPTALIVGVAAVLLAAIVFVGVSIARNAATQPAEIATPTITTPVIATSTIDAGAVIQTALPTAVPTTPPSIPDRAPDFTLPGASDVTFTLSQQLAEGPVILVFFQRTGG